MYDIGTVLSVLEARIEKDPSTDLFEGALFLHEQRNQFDRALEYYLKLGRVDIVEFVEKRELYEMSLAKLVEFVEDNPDAQLECANSLLKLYVYHIDKLPVRGSVFC